MPRMIFPQGNVPILANPNGYRDDPSVVSTIAQMFQARKQSREGNEQQIAAVFEQQAAKLDPETRAKYYADFVAKYPEAGKWLKGYDVSRPETMDEQVAKRKGQATLQAFDRAPTNKVEAAISDFVLKFDKIPTGPVLKNWLATYNLTPAEYMSFVRQISGIEMNAAQKRQSADRKYAVDTSAATSTANTQANINAQAGVRGAQQTYYEKRAEGGSGVKTEKMPDTLRSLFSAVTNAQDDVRRSEQEEAGLVTGGNYGARKKAQGAKRAVAADQSVAAIHKFNQWAAKVGYGKRLLPTRSRGLVWVDVNGQPTTPPPEGDAAANVAAEAMPDIPAPAPAGMTLPPDTPPVQTPDGFEEQDVSNLSTEELIRMASGG